MSKSGPQQDPYLAIHPHWPAELPPAWTVQRLKRIVAMRSGESITTDQLDGAGLIPVYGGNGIRGRSHRWTHDGDFVLVGRQGALCGNVHYATGRFWASEHAVVVSPRVEASTKWLEYLLRAMRLAQYSLSAAQPGLAVERILDLQVPVPPADQQYRIAAFLERECERIEELVLNCADLGQRTMEPALARLTELVKGFPRSRIGYRYTVQLGKMLDEKRIDPHDVRPYLRNTNVQWDRLELHDLKTMTFSASERRRYSLKPGDLLVCEGGQPGRSAIWNGEIDDCYFQKALMRVRPMSMDSTRYLMWCLRLASERGDFTADGTGSTILHLPAERLVATRVPLPTPDEQRRIAAEVDDLASRAESVSSEVDRLGALLTEYRDALIAEAVTGRLDVSRISERHAADAAREVVEGGQPEMVSGR